MNYTQVRNTIVKGLNLALGVSIVPTDSNTPRPDYPFVTYKFTTLYRGDGGVLTYRPAVYDAEYAYLEQPQTVISIMSYSLDDGESADLINNVRKWFGLGGRRYLKDNGIVVVDMTPIQDRTLQIVDNVEVRFGFDVTIRTVSESVATVEEIGHVTRKEVYK